jgi:hypothetical protein
MCHTHLAAPQLEGSSYNELHTNCVYTDTETKEKGKGKDPHWGTSAPQPKAYCAFTPKEFLYSSLEALHTERYAAPQLAK